MKEKLKTRIMFRLSCIADAISAFFLFLWRLPGFYRMHRFWNKDASFFLHAVSSYMQVMLNLSGNKLVNPETDAETVIQYAKEKMEET